MAHSPLCYKTRHRSAKRNHRYQISDIIIYRVTSSTRKTCVCKAASCGAPSRSERAPSGAHGGRMPTTSLLTRYSMYGLPMCSSVFRSQPQKAPHPTQTGSTDKKFALSSLHSLWLSLLLFKHTRYKHAHHDAPPYATVPHAQGNPTQEDGTQGSV